MTVNSPIWGGCIEKINVDTRSYNDKLGNLLPQVQAKLPGIKLVYQDTYGLVMDMINYPQKYGMLFDLQLKCISQIFFVSIVV